MCTGNICRSPMAEALLRQRLASRNIMAHVHSAGLLLDHEPAHPYATEVVKPLGLHLSGHRSRILSLDLLASTDLLIGMEMRHVREAVVMEPEVFGRAFTLPELVGLAEAVGPRTDDLESWLAALGESRKRVDVFKRDPRLEVPDPIGGSKRQFRRTVEVLSTLLDRFVELAWPRGGFSGHHGDLSDHSSPSPRST